MSMIKNSLYGLLAALLVIIPATAEVPGSLPLLKLSPDARSVALGEAGVAGAQGAMTIFHNPALMAYATRSQAAFGYTDWLLDLNIQTAAILFEYNRFAAGLSINAFNTPDLERRVLPSDDPIETFSAHDFAGGVSFAYRFTDQFALGFTGRWIHEMIYTEEADGYAGDIGAAYRLDSFFGITIGAALRNLGQMQALDSEESPLPTNAAIGLTGEIFRSGDISVFGLMDVQTYIEDDTRLHAGLEGTWKQHLFLRAGYQTGSELRTVSGGLGLAWDRFLFDYAYQPLAEDFDASHRLSFSIYF